MAEAQRSTAQSEAPIVSSLSGQDLHRKSERRDTKGNLIKKGGGDHHATFVDEHQPGTPVHTVKEVQAYKNSGPGGCCIIS